MGRKYLAIFFQVTFDIESNKLKLKLCQNFLSFYNVPILIFNIYNLYSFYLWFSCSDWYFKAVFFQQAEDHTIRIQIIKI